MSATAPPDDDVEGSEGGEYDEDEWDCYICMDEEELNVVRDKPDTVDEDTDTRVQGLRMVDETCGIFNEDEEADRKIDENIGECETSDEE